MGQVARAPRWSDERHWMLVRHRTKASRALLGADLDAVGAGLDGTEAGLDAVEMWRADRCHQSPRSSAEMKRGMITGCTRRKAF